MKRDPVYEIQNFACNINPNQLYINSFEDHLINNEFILEPHRHNFYVLVLFTGGGGTHDIDFCTFQIQRGSLFLMQPGQVHSWVLSSNPTGYVVFFTKEVYNFYFADKRVEDYPFFQFSTAKPEMICTEEEIQRADIYFNLMLEERQHLKLQKKGRILNFLDILLIELARKYTLENTHVSHQYNHQLKQFDELLENHFKTQKSPAFYADKMAITPKHLNRIAKNILNTTITSLITSRVILESKRLMLDRTKTLSQIAEELGYQDNSYFSRLFKKNAGITMREFMNDLNPDSAPNRKQQNVC